jgi:hypothetical protein
VNGHDHHQESDAPRPPAAGDTPHFPWPPAAGESAITAFIETWTGASLRPRESFRRLPDGTIRAALSYYIPLGIAVAGIELFWMFLLEGLDPEREAVLGEPAIAGVMHPVVWFLLSPLILLVSLFLAAGAVHALLALFGGANRPFTVSARVLAFAYSPQILSIVPLVGSVAGSAWMVAVAIIGLREAHATTTGRAAAAVLIPVASVLIFIAIATFVAATGRMPVY